ncbi:MAG: proprotein convertase P-domain-containing protein [Saprospiraceae bacterium]|nr:proprotein convertase P-domain-containing protein [Saprospiraceae bacterium]MBP7679653.1 proprotein convertase P-domain-containing protein [Saprospiraceae bacterium]
MRILFTILGSLLCSTLLVAQSNNFWQPVSAEQAVEATASITETIPQNVQFYHLLLNDIKQALKTAPMEFTPEAISNPLIITLPLPDGTFDEFTVVESPIMEASLAARWRQLRTYAARSIQHPNITTRFGYTELGFHAMLMGMPEGAAIIEPVSLQTVDYYVVSRLNSHEITSLERMVKLLDDPTEDERAQRTAFREQVAASTSSPNTLNKAGVPVPLRVYRFALGCTGEFANSFGGTVASVMSAFVTFTNTLNTPLMRDISMRFDLIAQEEELIHLSPQSDPYTNGSAGLQIVGVNGSIMNNLVGFASYDIGHCLTGGCNDGVAGVAAGQACFISKGNGVTCIWGNSVSALQSSAIQVAAHEIGHQFSGGHTFNNCPGAEDQHASGSAAEPGSGSTILSYAGICGNQNIQNFSDDYYHGQSLKEMIEYTRNGPGNTCPQIIETTNTFPTATLPYNNDFFIPIGTPFELTGSATDMDGDPLTYTWDQMDLGPISDIGSPVGDAPIFRSIYPSSNPTRVFPKMQTIINNASDNKEVLPMQTRNLTFNFIVRDNVPTSGGVVWETLEFKATAQAGPFLVTKPNAALTWEVGKYTEITWDVANTNLSPVNCQYVTIMLSHDGGLTYPDTLIANTQNDGSEFVTVPNIVTSQARIKVKAASSIFFDISNANFTIIPPTTPGYTVDVSPHVQGICLPDNATSAIQTSALLGYNSPITFDVLSSELPLGSTVTFNPNPVQPGQTSTLTIDLNDYNGTDTFNLQIRGVAVNADTAIREVTIYTVSKDFSALQLQQPANGATNLTTLPTFTWVPSPYADNYTVQVATNPSFAPNTLVVNKTGLTVGAYVPNVNLDENTLYYWRVLPHNLCSTNESSAISTFHTVTVACNTLSSIDVPINITAGAEVTVESNLDITVSGNISDMNVSRIRGGHDYIGDIEADLISPAGTIVKLFYDVCGNLSNFNLQLDDEAPSAIPCPPTDGQKHRPQGNLSDFNGQNTQGTWKLRIHDDTAGGGGGALEEWSLEFCADINVSAPTFVINDTMPLPSGATRTITTEFLSVSDTENTPEELEFRVMTLPQHGELLFVGSPMQVGDVFRQSTIQASNLAYRHDGSNNLFDNFTFTVSDGDGGWIPPSQFNTKIDNSVVLDVKDIDLQQLAVYPNPTSNQLHVVLPETHTGKVLISMYNTHGQRVFSHEFDGTQQVLLFNTRDLPNGIYYLQARTNYGTLAQTVSVIK